MPALHHKRRRMSRAMPFLFGFVVVLALGWMVWPKGDGARPLLSAALDQKRSTNGSVAGYAVQKETSPLDTMVPFLNTSANTYKVQQNPMQQLAVGGAGDDMRVVFETKSGLSVNFETGETFYAYNAQTRLPMASITKVMTAMVAIDLASMEEQFTVSRNATQVEPTVMGAFEGERMTMRELMQAALLMSANDAAHVLAEAIGAKYGGGADLFIAAMNEKARILGLSNTKFTNPQGYDNPDHYSTCEDLVVMSRYALTNYPDIARLVREKERTIDANIMHQKFWLPNWNMLIGTYPGADGIKIGNTGEAGHTTIASATREGKRVLSCVLGADGILKRDLAAAELLNHGFSKLNIAPYPMTEDLLRTRIKEWY